MKIIYYNQRAKEAFCSEYRDKWKYPMAVKEKLMFIEGILNSFTCLMDVINYPSFRFHKLVGNKKGQWSIYVGHTGYRVSLIPCDENEQEILNGDILAFAKSIKIVEIVEVSNHYE